MFLYLKYIYLFNFDVIWKFVCVRGNNTDTFHVLTFGIESFQMLRFSVAQKKI